MSISIWEEAALQTSGDGLLASMRAWVRFLHAQRMNGVEVPSRPALDEESSAEFFRQLRCSNGYLEFGSGGSTIVADKLGIPTVSVEGDRRYASVIRNALLGSAPIEILAVDIGLTREWSYPVFNNPTRRRLTKWAQYVHLPFGRLSELGWFPDFVLVDGRFRRACILETARQASLGHYCTAVMVDDYFHPDREHYHDVEQWLGAPQRFGRAALFRLPSRISATLSLGDVSEALKDYR